VTPDHRAAGGTVFVNGVSAGTGEYLVPPLSMDELARRVLDVERRAPAAARARTGALAAQLWRSTQPQAGVRPDVNAARLEEAGWAIVFAESTPPEVREALQRLIDHRAETVPAERLRVWNYTGESRDQWLADRGASPGSIDPDLVPYHILLVGDPEAIPYSFSQLLGTEYAVGRLDFDTANEYHRYARSVVEYETGERVPTAREVAFFATRHEGDGATELSADHLVTPLLKGSGATPPVAERERFGSRAFVGERATKAALGELLRGEGGQPSILFTATHGLGFGDDVPDLEMQRRLQGALICQQWPGEGAAPEPYVLAAADVPADASVQGTILFNFACFSGGTPALDQFGWDGERRLAERSFTAALPRALLAHPNGGALACIAHVDRAWALSIVPPSGGYHIQPFHHALWALMRGSAVGHAVRDFGDRCLQASNDLAQLVSDSRAFPVDEREVALRFVQRNDAWGYVVLGDPAVRLRTEAMPVPA
jgi:hypothetical protein